MAKSPFVFESKGEAERHAPRSNLYRLYRVVDPHPSPSMFVWERDPTHALGRAGEWSGVLHHTIEKPSMADLMAELDMLTPQERANVIAALRAMNRGQPVTVAGTGYVFKSAGQAWCHKDRFCKEDGRYRLYVIEHHGDRRYVWARSPIEGVGRAVADLGFSISVV